MSGSVTFGELPDSLTVVLNFGEDVSLPMRAIMGATFADFTLTLEFATGQVWTAIIDPDDATSATFIETSASADAIPASTAVGLWGTANNLHRLWATGRVNRG